MAIDTTMPGRLSGLTRILMYSAHDGQKHRPRQETGQSTLVRRVSHQRREAMFHEPAAHEPAQYPLHHRPQRTVRLGEPARILAGWGRANYPLATPSST